VPTGKTDARAALVRRARPRKRRSPDEARALILRACQALLAKRGPYEVGLKDIAKKAGVSHALVTHYFGTIDALIDAALEDHADRQRAILIERIASHPADGPRAWMKLYFEWVNTPSTAKMFGWALVSGRIDRDDFFSRRSRGAKRVADAVEARLRTDGATGFSREDLEFAILLLLAAPHGYALGRRAYWASLGVDAVGPDEDARFFERLAAVAESILGLSGRKRKRRR
jgi:AcrR family transcriptional regulator